MAAVAPNPWKDFFVVYQELAKALRDELARDSSNGIAETLRTFDAFIAKLNTGDSHDDWHRELVHVCCERIH